MNIGDKIKNLRKKADWTQEELAVKIGVSANLVSKWEKSERFPNQNHVEKLAACFNQSVHYFVPEKSQLVALRVFLQIEDGNFKFQYDDWENNYQYEKVASHLINNDIFEEDVTKLTQAEIDDRYFLFKDENNQLHIIRFDFKRIVDRRFYALKLDKSLVIRQLFNNPDESFYTIHVDNSMLEEVINQVKEGSPLKLDREDIIQMHTYSKEDKELIVGLVITSIRMIKR